MPVLISNVYTHLHVYFKMFYMFLKYTLKDFYIANQPKSTCKPVTCREPRKCRELNA